MVFVLDTINDDQAATPGERLRQARLKAGFPTVRHAARYIGVNYTQYYRHETGESVINAEMARLYAEKFAISPGIILYGEELRLPTQVPIVGMVGAGGVIKMVREDQQATTTFGGGQQDRVLWAIIVQGDDLYPAVRDGDKVYFAPLRPEKFNVAAVHGEECVCQLKDGTMLIRIVTLQPDGLVTLMAHAVPPMFNVDLVAASPVEFIERAGHHRSAGRVDFGGIRRSARRPKGRAISEASG
jgi:hypothetical protein